MKKFVIAGLLFLMIRPVDAQTDSLSLMECLSAARQYAAINNQRDVYAEIAKLKISNANATYFPGVSAYGKAWYQSDAVTIMGQNGPVLEVDPFQYNAGIEADQKLYDGGLSHRQKVLEQANLEAQYGKIETQLYQLNSVVTDLYFNSVLLEKNLEILQLKASLLDKRLKEMESSFTNGVIKRNDLEKMNSEKLLTQQQVLEIERQRQQIIASLAGYTGLDIDSETYFVLNESPLLASDAERPEYGYYDAEVRKLESMAHLQKAKNMPFLAAYGQAGYSYPGLNFYANEPDYYYIVGVKLSWTLFDWKQNKRETQALLKQKEIIETNRTDFKRNVSVLLQQKLIEQQKLLAIIEMDGKLVEQLSAVSRGSETALQNGVITSTEYLEDLNTEIKARLDLEKHKIELQQSEAQYRFLEGVDPVSFSAY